MLRWQEQIEKDLNILPMEAYKGQAVYKMVVMSPSMESLEICREELKDDFFLLYPGAERRVCKRRDHKPQI